jgi:single-strand DNA-binding protein
MNKVLLIGRMTKDPETRYTQSGTAVTTFTLAVDRRFKKEGQPSADFIACVAWNKLAEVIANNLVKGRKVGIEGRLQVRSYDAQDGSKRYVTEVIVDELDFCDNKNTGTPAPKNGYVPNEEIPF